MMKKFLVTILAVIYITSSIGANIHMHYCMGKMTDWGLRRNESRQCSKCAMEKKNGKEFNCCKYEEQFLKNISDQNTGDSGLQLFQTLAAAVPVAFFEIPATKLPSIPQEDLSSFKPPRSQGVAIYLFNRCILI